MQGEPMLFHSAAGTVLVDGGATTRYLGSARDEELLRASPLGMPGDSEAVRYYAWPGGLLEKSFEEMSRDELRQVLRALSGSVAGHNCAVTGLKAELLERVRFHFGRYAALPRPLVATSTMKRPTQKQLQYAYDLAGRAGSTLPARVLLCREEASRFIDELKAKERSAEGFAQ